MNHETKRQIRHFFTVIFAGVICAAFLSAFFLYYYSPTGTYQVEKVLIAPEGLSQISFSDNGRKYTFDHLEYLHFDQNENQWRREKITDAQYAAFYKLVAGQESLLGVDDEMRSRFTRGNPSMLTVVVRTEGGGIATKVFQQLQFVQGGDYFRVELLREKNDERWAYYRHPEIDTQVVKLLGGGDES